MDVYAGTLLVTLCTLLFVSDGFLQICLLFKFETLAKLFARITMFFGVNRSMFGYPPVAHATACGFKGVVEILLSRGADIFQPAKGPAPITAYEMAAKNYFDKKDIRTLYIPYKKEKDDREAAERKAKKEADDKRLAKKKEEEERLMSKNRLIAEKVAERKKEKQLMIEEPVPELEQPEVD